MYMPSNDQIDQLLASGGITQAQADQMRSLSAPAVSGGENYSDTLGSQPPASFSGGPVDVDTSKSFKTFPTEVTPLPEPLPPLNYTPVAGMSKIEPPKPIVAPGTAPGNTEANFQPGIGTIQNQGIDKSKLALVPQPTAASTSSDKPAGGGKAYTPPFKPMSLMNASREFEKSTDERMAERKENVGTQAAFEASKGEETARQFGTSSTNIALYEQQMQDRQKEVYQKAQGDLDNLNKEASKLSAEKIDTSHIYGSHKTIGTIGTAIAMAMGSYASAWTGRNDAMSVMNTAIDRDIDVQKNNIENKKAAFLAKKSLYGQQLELYKDENTASQATRSIMYEQARRRIEQISLNSNSDQVKLNADKALTEVKAKEDESKYLFRAQQAKIYADQQAAIAAARAAQTGMVYADPSTVVAVNEKDADGNPVVGKYAFTNTKAANEYIDAKSDHAVISQQLEVLKDYAANPSKNATDAVQRYQRAVKAYNEAQAKLPKFYSGRYNEEEGKRLVAGLKPIPLPTGITGTFRTAAIDQTQDSINSVISALDAGKMPVAMMPKKDKKSGNSEVAYVLINPQRPQRKQEPALTTLKPGIK